MDGGVETVISVADADAVAWLQANFNSLPLVQLWLPLLALVGVVALALGCVALLRLFKDGLALRRYGRLRRGGGSLDSRPRGRDSVLDLWCEILDDAAQEKHAVGPEALAEVLEARYAGPLSWLSGLRSTATLIGLFFTFLGLSITLSQLADALQVDTGEEVQQALESVRDSLPGLGTAFASSILGVGIALLIGVGETALVATRGAVTGGIFSLSARWIEPILATPHGVAAIPKLMDSQRKAFKDGLEALSMRLTAHLTKSSAQVETVVTSLAEAQGGLVQMTATTATNATALAEYAAALQELPQQTEAAWRTILDKQLEVHQTGLRGLADTSVASAKVFDTSLSQAEQRVAAMLSELEATSAPYIRNLESAAQQFTESTATFDALVRSSATSIEAGAEHVRSLVTASDRFREALVKIERVAEEEAERRARAAGDFQTVAEQVLPMAEAVSQASGATQKAVQRLEAVLGGKQMERYLEQLPRLTELVREEREARIALRESATTFQRVAASLEGMDDHAERFGQTSELVRAAHDELSKSVGELAQGHLLPTIRQVVGETARATATQHEEAWNLRYTGILDQHHRTLESLRVSIDRLEASQRHVLQWLTQSAWQRLRGRSDRQPER